MKIWRKIKEFFTGPQLKDQFKELHILDEQIQKLSEKVVVDTQITDAVTQVGNKPKTHRKTRTTKSKKMVNSKNK